MSDYLGRIIHVRQAPPVALTAATPTQDYKGHNMPAFLLNLASLILGSIVTLLVTKAYYVRASQDLIKEAEELRRLSVLVLHAMEDAGLASLNRDNSGRVVGLVISASAHEVAHASASAEAQVLRGSHPEKT